MTLIGQIRIFFIISTKRCESYFSNSELSGNLKPTLGEINLAKKLYIPLSKVIEKDSQFIYDSSKNNRKNYMMQKKYLMIRMVSKK